MNLGVHTLKIQVTRARKMVQQVKSKIPTGGPEFEPQNLCISGISLKLQPMEEGRRLIPRPHFPVSLTDLASSRSSV